MTLIPTLWFDVLESHNNSSYGEINNIIFACTLIEVNKSDYFFFFCIYKLLHSKSCITHFL